VKHLPPESFVDDLLTVCSALNQLEIPYMIIGGIAVALWANPRATIDLDFVIALHFFELKKIKIIRFSLCKDTHDLLTIDLILAIDSFLKAALDRRVSFTLSNQKLYAITPEDLILLKLSSARPQDIVDVTNVIAAQKGLDLPYLTKWAKQLKLTSQLKKLLKPNASKLS